MRKLKEVKNNFEVWDSNKNTKNSIPKDLLDQVSSLLDYFPVQKIIDELNLNPEQIRKIIEQKTDINSSPKFAEIPIKKIPMLVDRENFNENKVKIEILKPNLSSITIENLLQEDLFVILNKFFQEV